jgi:hypothetical protein
MLGRPTFNHRLKEAVLGDAEASLVFLGNFEVEERWSEGECLLPKIAAPSGSAVVNRLDAFALLLGTEDDHVVLKTTPDPDHLAHLGGLGLPLPTVHVPARQDRFHVVTEDVLADPALLLTLEGLARDNVRLSPHGVSALEEQLADRTGLALAAPLAVTCKRVNSKVYSFRLAEQLGLPQPSGWSSSTMDEFDEIVERAVAALDAGRRLVLKEAFGVSGKGLAVVESSARLRRLHRMVRSRACPGEAGAEVRAAFLIQDWVDKLTDLNYQFTISRGGAVHFDFVKEALTDGGVHKGHRIPPEIPGWMVDDLRHVADLVGKHLAADGFYGVVGVDGLVEAGGRLLPVIEINARNNMSTYQAPLQELLMGPGQVALARHYPLTLHAELPFAQVRDRLSGSLLERPHGEGLVVANHATANAAGPGETSDAVSGRLYGFLIAGSAARLRALDDEITGRLLNIEEGTR